MSESNTSHGAPEAIGRRIAHLRKRAGLTQQGLADLAHISRSLIQQVETGKKPATPSLIAAVARALKVDPASVYGQPYRISPSKDRVHDAIAEIRRILACGDVLADTGVPLRPVDTLAAEADALLRLSKDSKHLQVAARLPAVLDELTVHAQVADSPRVWRALNRAQSVAASFARVLGYADLAHAALQSAAYSAARADDEHLHRLVDLSRTTLLITIGAWDPALRLVQRASAGMDLDTAEARAVYGALQLRGAILSARAGRAGDAWEYHGRASEVAERQPLRLPDYYGLQMNRGNVAIHGAAVAVELGDVDEAIRRDRGLKLGPGVSSERRAHHQIDMGRALLAAGKHDQALQRLTVARRIAPQMTVYHPMAREIGMQLASHYRRLPEELRLALTHMGLS